MGKEILTFGNIQIEKEQESYDGKQKIHVCKKEYVWNPSKCICENGKHLASIMGDLTIICHEIITSYEKKEKKYSNKF